jgi:hypothetical protein
MDAKFLALLGPEFESSLWVKAEPGELLTENLERVSTYFPKKRPA